MSSNKRSASSSSPVSEMASKKQKTSNETSNSPIASSPRAEAQSPPTQAEPTPKEPMPNHETVPTDPSSNTMTPVKKAPKNPPIKTCFEPWKPTITTPTPNPFWGIKPRTGDPRPAPSQPPARTSDAATNPPLWEDRKYRFKRGTRSVKFFGAMAPTGFVDAASTPDLDQEDLLVLTLIDMRRISSKNPTPRRTPLVYSYEHGKPKDWNNMQTIKALNDRRGQAIDRITLDDPWTLMEREYLAALILADLDISIWELTEKFNDRFMGVDFVAATGFAWSGVSSGRTVESVRHEYRTYKAAYEVGQVPTGIRYKLDKSREGKAVRAEGRVQSVFGPSCKDLEQEWDESEENGKKMRDAAAALSEEDEELLALAGVYAPDEICSAWSAQQAVSEFLAAPESPLSDAPDGLLTPCWSPRGHQQEAIDTAVAWKIRSPSPKREVPRVVARAVRDIVIDENYDDEEL